MVNTHGPDPGDRRIPERFRLHDQLEHAHKVFDHFVRERCRANIDPSYRDELEGILNQNPALPIDFISRKIPVAVEGADTVRLNVMFSAVDSGGIGPFTDVQLDLFQDGSPFMFDVDVEKYPLPDYHVLAAAEYPPFIVHSDELMIGAGAVANYLARLRETGQRPRELTDQDCRSMVTAINLQTVDMWKTMEDSFIDESFMDHLNQAIYE